MTQEGLWSASDPERRQRLDQTLPRSERKPFYSIDEVCRLTGRDAADVRRAIASQDLLAVGTDDGDGALVPMQAMVNWAWSELRPTLKTMEPLYVRDGGPGYPHQDANGECYPYSSVEMTITERHLLDIVALIDANAEWRQILGGGPPITDVLTSIVGTSKGEMTMWRVLHEPDLVKEALQHVKAALAK